MNQLRRQVKGRGPTLVNADEANKLIDPVNSLLTLRITPDTGCTLTFGARDATLDLGPLVKFITAQVMQALTTGGTPAGTPSGGGVSTDTIVSALKSASLNINCNADGTITGNLNLPGL